VRVILLTHIYPRWPGDRSGASLAALARALLRRGISVRVVAPGEPGVEQDAVPIRRVRIGGRSGATAGEQDGFAGKLSSPRGWTALARQWRALRSAVRQEVAAGADLVHAHYWIPSGLAAPPGIPFVLTIHGPDAQLLRHSRLGRALAAPILQRAAVLTAVSRPAGELVQNLTGRFIGPEQVHPMPLETRGQAWTRGGGGALLVGPLDETGRVDLAIETIALLASYGHDLPLTVIGDGPREKALQQQAQDRGVAALVGFAGPVSPEQLGNYLARADLLLFTARGAPAAGATLEALITGVPVVACWDSGAAVDIVPESGAGRLSLPSAEALADSVLSLRADRDWLAVGRLVGEAWRARLAPDHVAQLCEGWYRRALDR
jgi:glycosyltransferase involved in cell wall biosynthesis